MHLARKATGQSHRTLPSLSGRVVVNTLSTCTLFKNRPG